MKTVAVKTVFTYIGDHLSYEVVSHFYFFTDLNVAFETNNEYN